MPNAAAGYALALLLSTTVVATQDAKVTTETKVTSDDGKVVTLIGCVEIGGGTSFVLTNITAERDQHERQQAPPGGSYALVERKGLDLGPFIQQRVELTGVVVPAATRRDTQDKIKVKETTRVDVKQGPDKKSSEATTVKVTRGAAAQFLVASVKTLAPTCQP
jgi:hypothetical protein